MIDDLHTRYSPLPRPLPGWLNLAAYALLGLVLLIGLPWTYLTLHWQHELNRRLDALRAAGQPMTLAEAAPPDAP